MHNKILFFSDIDDTLIQTRRKTDFTKNTVVASYNKHGEEGSFFYEGTKVFLDSLIQSNINFIPTTARNLDSYTRTIFYSNKKIKYAILNFGGLILIDNKIDNKWQNKIKKDYSLIRTIGEILENLLATCKEENLDLRVKVIDDFYISIYNQNNLDNQQILSKIKNILGDFIKKYNDYYLYENGNSFGILPHFLDKKYAVKYLIDKLDPILTIGAGDNQNDLGFMQLADFKLLPRGFKI